MYIAKPSHAVCAFLHSWIGICRKKWYFRAMYIHIQLQIRVGAGFTIALHKVDNGKGSYRSLCVSVIGGERNTQPWHGIFSL